MNQRAIACFAQALDDIGLPNGALRTALLAYFTWATETAMDAYPRSKDDVPAHLQIARWSWNSLES